MASESKKCKGCGESFRKGKRRLILNFDGTVSGAVVCSRCVSRSVAFVAPLSRATMTINGRESLEGVASRLRTYLSAAKIVSTQAPAASEFIRGRVAGLETGLELVLAVLNGVAA